MSVWPVNPAEHPSLGGREGELISLRIAVEPRLLEDLLETLAELEFPVNPQIQHQLGGKPLAVVEFPAYQAQLEAVRCALRHSGFPPEALEVRTMIEELHPH